MPSPLTVSTLRQARLRHFVVAALASSRAEVVWAALGWPARSARTRGSRGGTGRASSSPGRVVSGRHALGGPRLAGVRAGIAGRVRSRCRRRSVPVGVTQLRCTPRSRCSRCPAAYRPSRRTPAGPCTPLLPPLSWILRPKIISEWPVGVKRRWVQRFHHLSGAGLAGSMPCRVATRVGPDGAVAVSGLGRADLERPGAALPRNV